MIQRVKDFINNKRQDYHSKKRKIKLRDSLDPVSINHLKPEIKLNHKWFGNSYGGFYIHPDQLSSKSIIYSIGIGKDISFDLQCIKEFGCKVYGYDPTPKSINWVARQNLPATFYFHNAGITAGTSGPGVFYIPENEKATSGSLVENSDLGIVRKVDVQLYNLQDIMASNNHAKIDVLKMDIEGAEYDVLEEILSSNLEIDQILVEYHDRQFDITNPKSKALKKHFEKSGYKIFAASETYEEISYIKIRSK